jgi:hypothetical protein
MNAEQLMAHAAKAAQRIFKESGGVIPILHMVDGNGIHTHIHWATGFETWSAKQTTSQIMRKAVKEAQAVRYALVMEAWAINERGDSRLAFDMIARGESLEQHPDRIEVITILVEDKITQQTLTRQYQILRPEHGEPALSPPRELTTARGSGRFNNLFEEESDE